MPPRKLNGPVHGYPKNPCAELGAAIEPVKVAVNLGENLLNGIGGVIGIDQNALGYRKNSIVVGRVKLLERLAITGQKALDKPQIAVSRQPLY